MEGMGVPVLWLICGVVNVCGVRLLRKSSWADKEWDLADSLMVFLGFFLGPVATIGFFVGHIIWQMTSD